MGKELVNIIKIVLGAAIIVFFIGWGLGMLIPSWVEAVKSKPKGSAYGYEVDYGSTVMHFIMMAAAIALGIAILIPGNDLSDSTYIWFFVGFFGISWLIYIIVFFTSTQFQVINNFDSVFNHVYSYSEFEELWSSWNSLNPQIELRINSANDTHGCQSELFQYLSISSTNINEKPNKLNFGDYLQGKKGIALVYLKSIINFTVESETKISRFNSQVQKCPQLNNLKTVVNRLDTIPTLMSSILVSKNGDVPKKFQKKYVILEGIFWAGARLGFDLSALPIVNDEMKKIDVTLGNNFPSTFNCNQLKMSCWPIYFASECAIKSSLTKKQPKSKKIRKDNSLFRERLSRAYYLSDGTYSNFSTFEQPYDKKSYTWATPLVEEWILHSTVNGFARPPFHVGRYKNEIWIAVRGSHSLNDWVTDATAITKRMVSGSYHRGFYTAGVNIWPSLFDIFKKYEKGDYEFIFTGHSYGGAVANVLHRLAVLCFPDMKDRMYGFTFGAPPAMGETTAYDISPHTYSFINGNDPVPCLSSGNIAKFGFNSLLAMITLDEFESIAKTISVSFAGVFNNIHTLFYQNDLIDRPLGNVYHMSWKPWKKFSSSKLEMSKKIDYNKIARIHLVFTHHKIKQYGKKFMSYKDGVMSPSVFDKNVKITPLHYEKKNETLLELMNLEYNF